MPSVIKCSINVRANTLGFRETSLRSPAGLSKSRSENNVWGLNRLKVGARCFKNTNKNLRYKTGFSLETGNWVACQESKVSKRSFSKISAWSFPAKLVVCWWLYGRIVPLVNRCEETTSRPSRYWVPHVNAQEVSPKPTVLAKAWHNFSMLFEVGFKKFTIFLTTWLYRSPQTAHSSLSKSSNTVENTQKSFFIGGSRKEVIWEEICNHRIH